MRAATIAFFVFVGGALTLTGCSGVKESLGLTRNSPDEFAVVKRAPLEIPADLSALPEPRPGASRPQEKSPILQAQQTLFGEAQKPASAAPSEGETAILNATGATEAPPAIRATIDEESAELAEKSRPVADKLLGWAGGNGNAPASVVDAEKEAARIKENLDAGKPVTEGRTPVASD